LAEGRRGLGRGLSALLEEAGAATTPEARQAVGVRELYIEQIVRNPDQPRRTFSPEDLDELTASIRERGVISPIVVRPRPGGSEGEYQIVAGERRWRASQRAGRRTIPGVVRDLDDLEVMEIALIENIQRADLNALEEARGYAAMEARFGRNAEAIAKVVGKSRSHVANTLRLMRLPEEVRLHVEAGRLSAGHARALLETENATEIADRVVKQGLNVRQTEALARRAKSGDMAPRPRKSPGAKDADTTDLETTLGNTLGLKVEVLDSGGMGELRLHYKTLEQLDDLCDRLSAVRGRGAARVPPR
jgi:ParB family chromosome partitioning protein